MNGSPIGTLDDVTDVAGSALAGVQALRDADWYRLSRDELLAAGQQLETLARSVYAAHIRWVGQVQDTAAAAELSYPSTRVLLRQVLRIGPGDAADRVRAARALLPPQPLSGGQVPASLPVAAKAVAAGEIGAGHVAVISKAAAGWPKGVDPVTRDAAEQLLVDQARQVDPQQLTRAAQELERILDPDGDEPVETDTARAMALRLGGRNPRTGLTPIAGTLDDEAVEVFRQATDALAAPQPAVDGVRDPRPPATRLAQALVAALRGYLDAGAGPTTGGQTPHVTVTIGFDALTGRLSRGDAGARRADQHRPGPPHPVPDCSTPRSLRSLASPAMLTRCRLARDARILPAVLNGASQILGVGRAQRIFPPHLRHALVLRDGGCAWPGCDRPPGWCQAHHLTSWLDGGATSLANGVLLCLYHHQQAHASHWLIRIAADDRPEFIPPAWIDDRQVPRRNHRHRPTRT